MICPPGKSMIFTKEKQKKIEFVARPGGAVVVCTSASPRTRVASAVGKVWGLVKEIELLRQ